MDHPLLMDDFDDDLVSTKSVSDEDLFNATKERKASSSSGSSCGGGKKLPPSRKISEFSSGDEQESVELPSISAATDRNRNTSTSSPIEIKGSPTRENLSSRASSDSKGSPRSSSSVESAGNTNSRLSIFRVLTRRSSNQSKHKKLQDNWIQAREPVLDGVTFCVKFLGSIPLIDKTGASDAAEATRTVIQMVKAGQKTSRVGLKVSTRGISLLEPNTGETRLEISIYDIAHCSTDSSFPNVFSFIATNKNDVNECYCFATRKRKMAQHITLTIAQSFNLAFEIWQNSSSLGKDSSCSDQFEGSEDVRVIIGSTDSAKSCSSSASSTITTTNRNLHPHPPTEADMRSGQWVNFDEVDEITDSINSFKMIPLAPLDSANSNHKPSPVTTRAQQSTFAKHDDFLICLN